MDFLRRFYDSLKISRRKGLGRLPSLDVRDIRLPALFTGGETGRRLEKGAAVPNAALIYGVGSAILLVAALYSLFTGAWLNALLLFVLAGVLFGFALQYLQAGP